MRRNWNLQTLLVEMENGATPLENKFVGFLEGEAQSYHMIQKFHTKGFKRNKTHVHTQKT